MKLALDVWYEDWSRPEGEEARAADGGEVPAAEAVHDGGCRDVWYRIGRDAGGDLIPFPYLGL